MGQRSAAIAPLPMYLRTEEEVPLMQVTMMRSLFAGSMH
eukprot:CAMPEP_0179136550 /NCGR_PEP_ID=MMETSP0796-20121207/65077_1 /TAXON_ID=73915 /ORGANISM="Pyrodinium bahamense, Strain pbaha01" /LENGTH=38 /DNA_ID= /DNA_START= /DNA_END= /DNA_ORIENTATION=